MVQPTEDEEGLSSFRETATDKYVKQKCVSSSNSENFVNQYQPIPFSYARYQHHPGSVKPKVAYSNWNKREESARNQSNPTSSPWLETYSTHDTDDSMRS